VVATHNITLSYRNPGICLAQSKRQSTPNGVFLNDVKPLPPRLSWSTSSYKQLPIAFTPTIFSLQVSRETKKFTLTHAKLTLAYAKLSTSFFRNKKRFNYPVKALKCGIKGPFAESKNLRKFCPRSVLRSSM
jgi:hypothetical protein